MSEPALAVPGHNKPPVTAPSEEDMLADLRRRFPELETEWTQLEKDLATYPKKLTLSEKDQETAAALQDLLGKMKKHVSKLKAYKKDEKAPWSKVADVVVNFFTSRQEKAEAKLKEWAQVHEDFLEQKRDKAARDAEAEAERQREIAAQAQRAAEEAAQRQREAEERQREAERAEEEARQRAAEEQRKAKEAQEAAAAAEAREKQLAEEKKVRDRAEKEHNERNLRDIRRHMKDAEKLHAAAIETGDETTDDATRLLDAIIRPGGIVSMLAAPVVTSTLLDEEQRAEIDATRARLDVMRKAVVERMDAKERRRRAKEQKEAEEREAAAAETRRLQREEDERRTAAARAATEAAEKAAAEARANQKAEEAKAREARGEQRDAYQDQKQAGREVAQHGTAADRAGNRADRIDRKLDNSTEADLSRTRGDHGTVGSLARRWKHYLPDDENALRAVLGPLGPHFTTDALNGAVFQWMRAHQAGFTGERVEPSELPGVVFAYETDAVIR